VIVTARFCGFELGFAMSKNAMLLGTSPVYMDCDCDSWPATAPFDRKVHTHTSRELEISLSLSLSRFATDVLAPIVTLSVAVS